MATATAARPPRQKKKPAKKKGAVSVSRETIRLAAKTAVAGAGKSKSKSPLKGGKGDTPTEAGKGLLDDALDGAKSGTNESAGPSGDEVSAAPTFQSTAATETTGRKPPRKKRVVEVGGKFAVNQPPLKEIEDVDERVPALTEVCQRIIANKEKRRSLMEDVRADLGEVAKLLHEHDLDLYIVSGIKFYEEPGEAEVKMKKVKQQ